MFREDRSSHRLLKVRIRTPRHASLYSSAVPMCFFGGEVEDTQKQDITEERGSTGWMMW